MGIVRADFARLLIHLCFLRRLRCQWWDLFLIRDTASYTILPHSLGIAIDHPDLAPTFTGRGKLCPRRGVLLYRHAFSFSSGTFVIIAAVEGNGGIGSVSNRHCCFVTPLFLPLHLFYNILPLRSFNAGVAPMRIMPIKVLSDRNTGSRFSVGLRPRGVSTLSNGANVSLSAGLYLDTRDGRFVDGLRRCSKWLWRQRDQWVTVCLPAMITPTSTMTALSCWA
jgi:hypothetical protein